MSPEFKNKVQNKPVKQRGFLMPVAVFILIAMGLLSATLVRNTSQTSIASVQEIISVQAFFSAESGAQAAMNQLFYDTASVLTRSAIDARCTTMGASNLSITFSDTGLSNCTAAVSCAVEDVNPTSYYTMNSVGQCGSADVSASRTVRVSAYFQDQ